MIVVVNMVKTCIKFAYDKKRVIANLGIDFSEKSTFKSTDNECYLYLLFCGSSVVL